MARGGINKALVLKAREALLNRGENPSIDAIRVELGNTGSKSTIHRYLREIEEETSARIDDEALLSEPIKALIGRLTATLRQEAQAIVDDDREKYQNREQSLKAGIDELESKVAMLKNGLEEKDTALQDTLVELSARESSEDVMKNELAEAKQAIAELNIVVTEKQAHIESLEEKHQHNRDAMEHYRQSVKEQREQDQRNHEQQSHQFQTEMRALNQTLSVKQNDITALNKDNGRLVSEISAAQKTQTNLESECRKLKTQLDTLAAEKQSLETVVRNHEDQSLELEALRKEHVALLAWKKRSSLASAKLEAEIAVKTEMMDRLLEDKNKSFGTAVGKEYGSPDCEYD